MPTTRSIRKYIVVVSLLATMLPAGTSARTVEPVSRVFFPWVANGETIGGLGPWYSEISFQNLSTLSCPMSVYVARDGLWMQTAQLSLTAGAARTIGSGTLYVPQPGAPMRIEASCSLAASVKEIAPDVAHPPWSDGAVAVTGYSGINKVDVEAATAADSSAWFLPIAQTNSDWNTFIRVANFDDGGIDVTVELYPAGNTFGSEGAALVLTNHLGVAQGWTIDTLYELGTNDWVGYAKIKVSGDAAAIALRTKASTAMALTNVAVAADAAVGGEQFVAAAPLLFNAYNGWNTGINVANVSDQVTDVQVRYYEAGGGMVKEEDITLLPQSMQYIYTPGAVDETSFVGSAKIVSDAPVVSAIDEVKYETIEGLSYIASTVGQTDAAIPLAFREDLDSGPHDNSGINVSNLNLDAEQDVQISLVDKTGTPILPDPIVLTLPAGGSNYIYLPFDENVPPGTQASVRITSNDPAGFVAISNDINYVVIGDGSVVFSAGSPAGYYRVVGTAAP